MTALAAAMSFLITAWVAYPVSRVDRSFNFPYPIAWKKNMAAIQTAARLLGHDQFCMNYL
jgi:hypothetical protein